MGGLLAAVGWIDPIKWIDDAVSVVRFGSGVRLLWVPSPGFYGADVERILRTYGCRVYARKYAFSGADCLGVTVRKEQAEWAAYVLGRAGVPVVAPAWAVGAADPARGMPLSWGVPAKATGFGGMVAELFGGGPSYSKEEKRARRERSSRAPRKGKRGKGGTHARAR